MTERRHRQERRQAFQRTPIESGYSSTRYFLDLHRDWAKLRVIAPGQPSPGLGVCASRHRLHFKQIEGISSGVLRAIIGAMCEEGLDKDQIRDEMQFRVDQLLAEVTSEQ